MPISKPVKIEKKNTVFWRKEEDRLRRVLIAPLRSAGNRAAQEAIANVGTVSDTDRRRIFQRVDALSSQRATQAASVVTNTTRKQMDLSATKYTQESLDKNDLENTLDVIFSTSRAKAIGITEITHIVSLVTFETYDRLGKAMIWQTSEDELVCAICTPKNGDSIITVDELPPAHVSCRCRIGLEDA